MTIDGAGCRNEHRTVCAVRGPIHVVSLLAVLASGCASTAVIAQDDLPRLAGLADSEYVRVRDIEGSLVTIRRDTVLSLNVAGRSPTERQAGELRFGLASLRLGRRRSRTVEIPYHRLTLSVRPPDLGSSAVVYVGWGLGVAVVLALPVALLIAIASDGPPG